MYLFVLGLPIGLFSIYSYALIDPNITFFQTDWWVSFRDQLVHLGYHERSMSWLIYLSLLIVLYLLHGYLFAKSKRYNAIHIALVIGAVTVFSYPFLSHDFLNYLFDAKIVTYYHQNPYLHAPMDFPGDPWLRFMHWTHRTYPYGPSFLPLTLIPSFLSFGKFILSFLFSKIVFAAFYILGVFYLNKLEKKWAIFFATNPLIIIEGLINAHNDLIAVSVGFVGIYYLLKNKSIAARFLFLLSAGIKYITLPLVFLSKSSKKQNFVVVLVLLVPLLYLSLSSEVQPWYFLALFALLPFYDRFIYRLSIFFAGLLLSYYPYIGQGAWDRPEYIETKHSIILIFLLLNLCYLAFSWGKHVPLHSRSAK